MKEAPFVPITTRQQMVHLLNQVREGRVGVMDALARIEAWGDDFARRNTEDQLRRAAAQNPWSIVHDDGPRRGPNVS